MQAKLGSTLRSTQSSLNSYENRQATPTVPLLRAYADYFNASADYIFARTDNPQEKFYYYQANLFID